MSDPKDFNYVYTPTIDNLPRARDVVLNNTCALVGTPLPLSTPTVSTRPPIIISVNGKYPRVVMVFCSPFICSSFSFTFSVCPGCGRLSWLHVSPGCGRLSWLHVSPGCGRLSWLHVSFLLHVKYTLSYRIVGWSSRLYCWLLIVGWSRGRTAAKQLDASNCFSVQRLVSEIFPQK